MSRRRSQPLVPVGLATLGLVVALALGPVARREILAGYVLALTAVALLYLTRVARGEDPWLRPSSELERALVARGETRMRPAELVNVQRDITLGSTSAGHFHSRLHPMLRDVAAARLAARHNVDLERHPDAARRLLGDEAWELVRPDRDAPDDLYAPGLPLRTLAAVLDRIEGV
jgi:hypothetical protein